MSKISVFSYFQEKKDAKKAESKPDESKKAELKPEDDKGTQLLHDLTLV